MAKGKEVGFAALLGGSQLTPDELIPAGLDLRKLKGMSAKEKLAYVSETYAESARFGGGKMRDVAGKIIQQGAEGANIKVSERMMQKVQVAAEKWGGKFTGTTAPAAEGGVADIARWLTKGGRKGFLAKTGVEWDAFVGAELGDDVVTGLLDKPMAEQQRAFVTAARKVKVKKEILKAAKEVTKEAKKAVRLSGAGGATTVKVAVVEAMAGLRDSVSPATSTAAGLTAEGAALRDTTRAGAPRGAATAGELEALGLDTKVIGETAEEAAAKFVGRGPEHINARVKRIITKLETAQADLLKVGEQTGITSRSTGKKLTGAVRAQEIRKRITKIEGKLWDEVGTKLRKAGLTKGDLPGVLKELKAAGPSALESMGDDAIGAIAKTKRPLRSLIGSEGPLRSNKGFMDLLGRAPKVAEGGEALLSKVAGKGGALRGAAGLAKGALPLLLFEGVMRGGDMFAAAGLDREFTRESTALDRAIGGTSPDALLDDYEREQQLAQGKARLMRKDPVAMQFLMQAVEGGVPQKLTANEIMIGQQQNTVSQGMAGDEIAAALMG